MPSAPAQTVMDLGWDPVEFASKISRRYEIKDIEGSGFRPFGDLLAQNRLQQRYMQEVMDELAAGGPVRIIVLKSRKPGVSTATGVLFYDITTSIPAWDSIVLAHQQDSTDELFRMVRNLYFRTTPEVRPLLAAMNGTNMRFGARYLEELEEGEFGLGSSYSCMTAGGLHPFAGTTPRAAHISEAAKLAGGVEKQKDMILNVINAVPMKGPSIIVVEGTANGADEEQWFYNTWQQAWAERDKPRRPGMWRPIFLSFKDDPNNQVAIPDGYNWFDWPIEDLEREDWLAKVHSVTREQLYFRRLKLRGFGGEGLDAESFDQEYPVSPDVAFRSKGSHAIPPRLLDLQARHAREPISYACRLEDADDAEALSHPVKGW